MFSSIRYTSNKIFFQKSRLDVYDLDKNNLKKKPIVRMYVSMPFKNIPTFIFISSNVHSPETFKWQWKYYYWQGRCVEFLKFLTFVLSQQCWKLLLASVPVCFSYSWSLCPLELGLGGWHPTSWTLCLTTPWMMRGTEEGVPQACPVYDRYELWMLFHKWWAVITEESKDSSKNKLKILSDLSNDNTSSLKFYIRRKIQFNIKCV